MSDVYHCPDCEYEWGGYNRPPPYPHCPKCKDTTMREGPLPNEPMTSRSDIEIFLRPASEYKDGENEQVLQYSYREFARHSNHSIINQAEELLEIPGAGEWKIGIRERGDEQYFQQWAVVEPHASERGEYELQNHLSGVLHHWRA